MDEKMVFDITPRNTISLRFKISFENYKMFKDSFLCNGFNFISLSGYGNVLFEGLDGVVSWEFDRSLLEYFVWRFLGNDFYDISILQKVMNLFETIGDSK